MSVESAQPEQSWIREAFYRYAGSTCSDSMAEYADAVCGRLQGVVGDPDVRSETRAWLDTEVEEIAYRELRTELACNADIRRRIVHDVQRIIRLQPDLLCSREYDELLEPETRFAPDPASLLWQFQLKDSRGAAAELLSVDQIIDEEARVHIGANASQFIAQHPLAKQPFTSEAIDKFVIDAERERLSSYFLANPSTDAHRKLRYESTLERVRYLRARKLSLRLEEPDVRALILIEGVRESTEYFVRLSADARENPAQKFYKSVLHLAMHTCGVKFCAMAQRPKNIDRFTKIVCDPKVIQDTAGRTEMKIGALTDLDAIRIPDNPRKEKPRTFTDEDQALVEGAIQSYEAFGLTRLQAMTELYEGTSFHNNPYLYNLVRAFYETERDRSFDAQHAAIA